MKIRCQECKKRFDYELYSGVCPACGTYARSEEETDISAVRTEDHSPATAKRPIETLSTKEAKKKYFARIYTAMILFLMIVVGIGTYAIVSLTKNNREEERKLASLPEPVTVQQGEPFSYDTEDNRYDITIDSVMVDEDPAWNVPYGYEMLMVSYHIERIYTGSGSGDYDSFYQIAMNPYVETKSGAFLESVGTYDLKNAKALVNAADLEEMGITTDFSRQEGKIYYLVKEDDFKALYITSVDYDTYKYDYGALREIIRVEGLEVQR